MNDPWQRLRDIVVICGDAAQLVARGRAAFDTDPLLVRAAKNIVTEIGEAAKGADPLTDRISTVPWRAVAGMRDLTIHRYPDVQTDILWRTLLEDLPNLSAQVAAFLDENDRSQ